MTQEVDMQTAYELMKEANELLILRNCALAQALGDMLRIDPTEADRQRAIQVWCKEMGLRT
jgi:hypothetical protein